jgi:hypothetical protein
LRVACGLKRVAVFQLTYFIIKPDNDQVNRFSGIVILYPQYKQI